MATICIRNSFLTPFMSEELYIYVIHSVRIFKYINLILLSLNEVKIVLPYNSLLSHNQNNLFIVNIF